YAGWSESTGANLWKSPTVDLHIPRLRPMVIGWCSKRRASLAGHEMFEHCGGVSYAGWSESTGANLWKSPTVDLHIPRLRPMVIGWCSKRRASLAGHEMFEHCGGVSYAGWSESTGANLWKSPTVDLHIPRLRPMDEMLEHCGGISYADWTNFWKSPTVDCRLSYSEITINDDGWCDDT
ncbi:15226_t:CDS:2, partial [Dentiscutata heterogama]